MGEKKEPTLRQRVTYVLAHAAIAALIWAGVFGGVEWAGNVLLFLTWLGLVVGCFLAALMLVVDIAVHATGDAPKDMREGPPPASVPSVVDWWVDLALALALAAGGWLWTAAAWLLKGLAFRAVRWFWQSVADHDSKSKEDESPANRVAEHLRQNGDTTS